jgi:hypothetical protein
MNFIVAGILFHCEEYISFWNFIILYEDLQLRDIYKPSTDYNYMIRIAWDTEAYPNY